LARRKSRTVGFDTFFIQPSLQEDFSILKVILILTDKISFVKRFWRELNGLGVSVQRKDMTHQNQTSQSWYQMRADAFPFLELHYVL
jgi:hypothetical protein